LFAEEGFDAKQREQIFNNYREKSNGEWLLGYGFPEGENESDIVPLHSRAIPGAQKDSAEDKLTICKI
jgi:hypothetical protein